MSWRSIGLFELVSPQSVRRLVFMFQLCSFRVRKLASGTDNWTQMQTKKHCRSAAVLGSGRSKWQYSGTEAHPCVLCCNVFTLDARLLTVRCFARLCQSHRRAANELVPICALAAFLAPSPEELVQMVDALPSSFLRPELNKYSSLSCLCGGDTEASEKSLQLAAQGLKL